MTITSIQTRISNESELTEAPTNVDVEVDAVVAVVHQDAVACSDQWAEVVLLPVCVEHGTRNLHTGDRVSRVGFKPKHQNGLIYFLVVFLIFNKDVLTPTTLQSFCPLSFS